MFGGNSRPFSISRYFIGLVLFIALAVSGLAALPTLAASTINRSINYQGRLLTSGGTNVADGTYPIKFSVYDVASGGTALWTASGTTAVPTAITVQVTDGLFSVLLGDTSFQGQNAFDIDWNQDGLYLGVTVSGDTEMTPRKRLSAVPYAFNSEALQGQYASSSNISGTSGTGTLFTLNQASSTSASATRTTLLIETAGTSNFYDYLLRARPTGGADVFSISRQGNVTSTGNFVLGDANSDVVTVNARFNTDLIPSVDLQYSLGSPSLRWLGLNVGTVTSTNIFNSGTVSSTNLIVSGDTTLNNVTSTNLYNSGTVSTTQLFVNGTQIIGGTPATTATLQTITDNGATSTNLIYAQGGVLSSVSSTLQLLTFTSATGSAVTTTNLYVSGTASTSQLFVNGQTVCLTTGTNCPTNFITSSTWQFDNTSNIAYLTTSTQDVLIGGGNTTSSALFVVDYRGNPGTATNTILLGGVTTTYVGIGTSTPVAALDVVGQVNNLLQSGSDMALLSEIDYGGGFTQQTVVDGNTMYAIVGSTLHAVDITDSRLPRELSSAAVGGSELKVIGNIAYVYGSDSSQFSIVDVSDPSLMQVVGTYTTSTSRGFDIVGKYAYLNAPNGVTVVDISSSTNPVYVNSGDVGVNQFTNGGAVHEHNGFLYVFGNAGFAIFDIRQTPEAPVYVTSSSQFPAYDFKIQGSQAYIIDFTNGFSILDLTQSATPTLMANIPADTGSVIAVSGRYAFTNNQSMSGTTVYDISSSTNPIALQTIPESNPNAITVSGNKLILGYLRFFFNPYNIRIHDIAGIETASLVAHSAEVGNLNVVKNVQVAQNATIGGSLFVGNGGLFSQGGGEFGQSLRLNGVNVCLQDGTNCSGGGGSSFWSYDNGNDILYPTTSTQPVYVETLVATDTFSNILRPGAGYAMSSVSVGTNPEGVAIQGRYAYVTNSGSGSMSVVEMGTFPVVVGGVSLPGNVQGLVVSGRYAYVVNDSGLLVVDISNPVAPTLVGTVAGLNGSAGVALSGQYAYVTSYGDSAVYVVDVSNAAHPFVAAQVSIGAGGSSALGIDISGRYAYVTAYSANFLAVIDIQNPLSPVLMGNAAIGNGSQRVAVQGRYAYTTSLFDDNVTVIDVADPANPTVIATTTVGTGPIGLAVSGRYLYTADRFSNSVTVVDILDPYAPVTVSTILTSGGPYDMKLSGRYVYFTRDQDDALNVLDLGKTEVNGLVAHTADVANLHVLNNGNITNQLSVGNSLQVGTGGISSQGSLFVGGNISNLLSPERAPQVISSSTLTGTGPAAVYAEGRLVYAVNNTSGELEVFDYTNPVLPRELSTLPLAAGGTYAITGNGSYVYTVNYVSDVVHVIDVSRPAAPVVLSTTTLLTTTQAQDITVNGNYLYIAGTGGSVIAIVDVTHPESPIQSNFSAQQCSGTELRTVKVRGRYLYTGCGTDAKMDIYDLQDPLNPTFINSQYFESGTDTTYGIDVQGGYAYVANFSGDHFNVVDVTNPASPVNVATTTLLGGSGPYKVVVSGRYAYVANYSAGTVSTIDITSSTAPFIAATTYLPVGFVAYDLFLSGRYLYVVDNSNSRLAVVDIGGVETSGVIASAAELGSLTVRTDGFVAGNWNVGTALSVGFGGILSTGSLSISSTNTTSTISYAVSSTAGEFSNRLTVGGVNVCLQDGTNCPGGGGSSSWTYDNTNDVLYTTTPTQDVLMGGDTTSSALFVLDYRGNTGTATNTILFGGVTSTLVGIGTSTPAATLDVVGSVNNLLRPGQTISTPQDISDVGISPNQVVVNGNYMYVVDRLALPNNFRVLDVSNAASSSLIGSLTIPFGAVPERMAIVGSVAYVIANSPALLVAIDLSNPSSPSVISSVSVTDTDLRDIDVRGEYAYVSSFTTGAIETFSISNPANMTSVVQMTSGTHGWNDLEVQGNYLYAVDNYTPTLQVYDATSTSLLLKGEISIAGAIGLSVQGRYAYVTLSTGGVNVVDISNPSNPQSVGSLVIGSNSTRSAVDGRYLYISNESGGTVSIVDISSSTSPALVSTIAVGSTPRGLAVAGKYLYVPNYGGVSVSVIDLLGTEVSSLTAGSAMIGGLQVLQDVFIAGKTDINGQLSVGGKLVCLSDGTGCPNIGGWTENTTNNTLSPTVVTRDVLMGGNTSATAGFVYDFDTAGTSTLFIGAATNTNVVFGVNTTSYTNITGLSNFFMDGNDTLFGDQVGVLGGMSVRGNIDNALGYGQSFRSTSTNLGLGYEGPIVVHDHYMYQADNANLVIYDISQYGVPRVLAATNYFSGGNYNDIAYFNGLILLSSVDGYHAVVDVSSSTNPTAVVQWGNGGAINRQHALPHPNGRYVYSTNGANQINVTDFIDPANPVELFTTSTNSGGDYIYEMVTDGRYLYVAVATSNKFEIYDLKNPTRPTKISELTFSNVAHLAVQGDYVYFLEGPAYNTLSVIDVTDRVHPSVVATVSPAGADRADSIIAAGRYVYLGSAGPNNVDIYDISSSTNPVFIQNITDGTMDATNITLNGKYLYTSGLSRIGTIDVGGVETNALQAYTAELTRLTVKESLNVLRNARIDGALQVGSINETNSYGSVSVYASTTSGTVMQLVNNAVNLDAVLEVRGGCSAGTRDLALFGTNSDNREVSIRCNGQIFADNGTVSTPADYAEYFYTSTTLLQPGMAVALDTSAVTSTGVMLLGQAELRGQSLGIVSTAPGFVTNGGDAQEQDPAHWKAVALIGQVPAIADASSMPIMAGDEIMMGTSGTVVRAQGPGYILGRALEGLASGTGTIRVFVQPSWWAGDLLGTDGSGNALLMKNLAVASTTIASVSTTLVDSPYFTFTGKAWDSASSTAVTHSYQMFVDMLSASSSLFTVADASGTALLTLSNEGDLTVHGKLYLANKSTQSGSTSTYLFIDDTAPSSTMISTNADGFQAQAAYDYAERYPSQEVLQPGDLVTYDASGPVNSVKRTTASTDAVFGIVSTKPGFLTGAYVTGTYPIALAGRVPTRVTASNGEIHVGDALTSSDIPGVAMKATQPGIIVGYALEAYAGAETGLVQVFVKTGYFGGTVTADGKVQYAPSVLTQKIEVEGLANIAAGSQEVKIRFESLKALPTVYVTPGASVDGGWWITDKSDTGFTIVLEKPQTHDVEFSWMARPMQTGVKRFLSDTTFELVDPLTGKGIPDEKRLREGASTNTDITVDPPSGTDVGIEMGSGGETATSTPEVTP